MAAEVEAHAHCKAHNSSGYSNLQAHTADLSPQELAAFQRDAAAWAFFEAHLRQACTAGERVR